MTWLPPQKFARLDTTVTVVDAFNFFGATNGLACACLFVGMRQLGGRVVVVVAAAVVVLMVVVMWWWLRGAPAAHSLKAARVLPLGVAGNLESRDSLATRKWEA